MPWHSTFEKARKRLKNHPDISSVDLSPSSWQGSDLRSRRPAPGSDSRPAQHDAVAGGGHVRWLNVRVPGRRCRAHATRGVQPGQRVRGPPVQAAQDTHDAGTRSMRTMSRPPAPTNVRPTPNMRMNDTCAGSTRRTISTSAARRRSPPPDPGQPQRDAFRRCRRWSCPMPASTRGCAKPGHLVVHRQPKAMQNNRTACSPPACRSRGAEPAEMAVLEYPTSAPTLRSATRC